MCKSLIKLIIIKNKLMGLAFFATKLEKQKSQILPTLVEKSLFFYFPSSCRGMRGLSSNIISSWAVEPGISALDEKSFRVVTYFILFFKHFIKNICIYNAREFQSILITKTSFYINYYHHYKNNNIKTNRHIFIEHFQF